MRISEIFHSIQGEGAFAGTPTVFVRTTGCNLRCWFCDTPYTSWDPEGERRSWQSVLEAALAYDCEHVDVTGGEPLLQPEVVPLTRALREAGRFVTIETAGTVFRPVHADLISLSPKLLNSTPAGNGPAERHERLRDNPAVVARLLDEYPYQVKFVVDRPEDLSDIEAWLARFPTVPADRVWLMPQGVQADELRAKTEWLAVEAGRRGFKLSPRLHNELFGNLRGP
jgi:7-carboxy-7-deazaguanine synthase